MADQAKTTVADDPIVRFPKEEQVVLLHDLTWEGYTAIGEVFRDRPAIRLTYFSSNLEVMTTSMLRYLYQGRLQSLIFVLAEELDLPFAPAGHMTFMRKDLEIGFECDDCFWFAHERRMRAKKDWVPLVDPPPDLITEIDITPRNINRMKLFAALGIPEVWHFDGQDLRVFLLGPSKSYKQSDHSSTFCLVPFPDLAALVRLHLDPTKVNQEQEQPPASIELRRLQRRLKYKPSKDHLGWIRLVRGWIRSIKENSIVFRNLDE